MDWERNRMNNLPTKFIPINRNYCYSRLVEDGIKVRTHGLCPYWKKTGEYSASCAFLDYDEADHDCTPLLFDQVKICGENDDRK